MRRRDFSLFLSTGLLTLLGSPQARGEWGEEEWGTDFDYEDHPISILQGMTDETSAQFSLVVPKALPRFYKLVKVGSSEEMSFELNTIERNDSDWVVDKIFVKDLTSGECLLQVYNDEGRVVDERLFSTLDLQKSKVRCALVSCMDDILHRREIWDRLDGESPDISFFLGDSVYADKNFPLGTGDGPRIIWKRYVETRQKLAYYHQRRLIPTLAIWDDHDMGVDQADSSYPYKEESRQIFEAFFAQDHNRENLERGPGTSSIFTAFGQDFYFLDGRTFRADEGLKPSFFGWEQEDWLFAHLTRHSRPGWLISGLQWLGGYHGFDSFEKSGSDFERFLGRLKQAQRPVAFMGGDIHFSEVMRIEPELLGFESLELTSSSIHSATFWGWDDFYSNPRRVDSTARHNFCILDMESRGERLTGELKCLGRRERPWFEHSFDLFGSGTT